MKFGSDGLSFILHHPICLYTSMLGKVEDLPLNGVSQPVQFLWAPSGWVVMQ